MCIPLCRQPLPKLVDSIPSPPNWLGWYGDRACCAHRREIGGVRHAPINAAGPATPAFVSAAVDWRNRHQSPALVPDHLGDFRRRVVIPDVVSSQERLRSRTRLLSSGATQQSGYRSSLPIEPTFVGGAACAPAAIKSRRTSRGLSPTHRMREQPRPCPCRTVPAPRKRPPPPHALASLLSAVISLTAAPDIVYSSKCWVRLRPTRILRQFLPGGVPWKR
jgi:hypothetical protein